MDTATLIIVGIVLVFVAWFVLLVLVAFAPILLLASFIFAAFVLFGWPGAIVALIVLLMCLTHN
jgi:hypothetical protein